MSRRADARDNTSSESLFRALRVEIYRVRYEMRAQSRMNIDDCIQDYYNRQRLHNSIGFRPHTDYGAVRSQVRLLYVETRHDRL